MTHLDHDMILQTLFSNTKQCVDLHVVPDERRLLTYDASS